MKQIEITNFKGITHMSLAPEHINLFLGKNGAGKSSILEAIRYCLTGHTEPGTIKKGAPGCAVSVIFNDDSSIIRSNTDKGNLVKVNGKRTTQKAANEYVEQHTGVSPEVLDKYLTSDVIDAMDKKELTGFFFSVLPMTASMKKIMEMSEKLKGSPLTDGEKAVLQAALPIDGITIDMLNTAYSSLYKKRTERSGVVKALMAKTKDIPEKPEKSKEEIRNRLNAIAKAEAEQKAYANAVAIYQRNFDDYKGKIAKAAEMKKAATAIDAVKPDEAIYRKNRSDRKQFEEAITRHNGLIAAIKNNNAMMEKAIAELSSSVCPLSKRLVCTTDKTSIKAEMEAAIAHNKGEIEKGLAFVNRCKDQIERLDKELEAYMANSRIYDQKISLEKQAKLLEESKKPEMPVKPDVIAVRPGETEELNKMLSAHAVYEEYERNVKTLAEAQQAYSDINFAVILLNPKTGIANEILGNVTGKLEQICNKKAETLNKDLRISIHIHEGVEILYNNNKGSDMPMSSASSGEKVLIQYLLMTAVNAVVGSKIMVLDNLDRLDAISMKDLLQLLDGDNMVETVFCASVDHSELENVALELRNDSRNSVQLIGM